MSLKLKVDFENYQMTTRKHVCLITGQPTDRIQPVRLRRMVYLLFFWVGGNIQLPLALSESRSLVSWQYVRTFRWAIALLLQLLLLKSIVGPLFLTVAVPLRIIVVLGPFFLVYMGLGLFLRTREFIRLSHVCLDRRYAILKFSSFEVMQRFIDNTSPESLPDRL